MRKRKIAMRTYWEAPDNPKDQNKLEQIYHRYRDLMYYVAYRILHNEHDAEDAVHEAFLTIMKNLQQISSVRSRKTKGYVVTITENKAIDLYRRQRRHPEQALTEDLPGLSVSYSGDDTLTACFLRLPARYREYLLLRYDSGFSNQEIAAMLGLSDAATRKLGERARAKLEILCKEEGLL